MSKKAIKRYEKDNPFLVVVDIQPSYHPGSYQVVPDIIEKMNNTEQNIIFFYVGKEFDLDSKEDVVYYLLENGLDENRIPGIKFIEKTYGYYRSWMDNGVEDNIIVNSIKVMEKEEIYDSRDFTEEHWEEILGTKECYDSTLRDDNIYHLDFDTSFFKHKFINNLEIVGGGRNECLKELELYFKAIGKDLVVNEKLCYGDNYFSYQNDYNALKKMRKI